MTLTQKNLEVKETRGRRKGKEGVHNWGSRDELFKRCSNWNKDPDKGPFWVEHCPRGKVRLIYGSEMLRNIINLGIKERLKRIQKEEVDTSRSIYSEGQSETCTVFVWIENPGKEIIKENGSYEKEIYIRTDWVKEVNKRVYNGRGTSGGVRGINGTTGWWREGRIEQD